MLIATFGPTTGWSGKTITYVDSRFFLQDHGDITAADVMRYDEEGHLLWEGEGTRAWVGSLASRPTPARMPPERPTPSAKSNDGRTSGQKAASLSGVFLLVVGLLMAFYFVAAFDTSVAVDYSAAGGNSFGLPERVNNIGLMQDRQIGITVGLIMAFGGGVLMFIGRKRHEATMAAPMAYPLTQPALAEASPGSAPVAELERLAALHASGAISDEEFSALKSRLMDGSSR